MFIEIIVIILSFLITGYGIYRFGGEEKPGQQIEVQGGGDNLNDIIDNNPLNINNEPNYHNNINNEIINDNNINNINNGNTKNNTNGFKIIVMQMIKNKEKNNKIDWGDLETTANAILRNLIDFVKRWVQDPLAEIKEILNEEKLKKGEEVVKKWIDKNRGEEVVKKWIDINSGFFIKTKIGEIAILIYGSEENTYMFKNIDTDKEEEKKLLTGCEIIGFLNKIKGEKEEELLKNMNDGEILQMQENDFVKLQTEQQEKEEKEREEEKKEKELEEGRKKYNEEAEIAKRNLEKEPDINAPGVCSIKFNSPDRERFWERRFLKTDKISTLYKFVKSIGSEIFIENDATDFDILSSGFPQKSLKDKKNNTLEQEGLFPNAEIQIREE